jgi:hypothetical protein
MTIDRQRVAAVEADWDQTVTEIRPGVPQIEVWKSSNRGGAMIRR